MPLPAPLTPLLDASEDQDRVFASAFSVLEEAIAERAFPAASVAIAVQGRLVAVKAFGRFTYESSAQVASPTTLFDLASLTKVVATTPMAMLLYQRGLLDLDAPVSAVVPEFLCDAEKDPRRREVTFRMLLAHSSGLPAYEKLFLKTRTGDELLHEVFITPLATDPGSRAEYSDIGFILLGVAMERLADESLERFCLREIFAPLGMTHIAFNPPSEIRTQIPPTADDRDFRHRIDPGRGAGRERQHSRRSCRTCRTFFYGYRSRSVRPCDDQSRCTHSPRDDCAVYLPRIRTCRHISHFGMGYALRAFAVGEVFRASIFWASGVHGNVSMDRSRPATLNHFTHQPHLA